MAVPLETAKAQATAEICCDWAFSGAPPGTRTPNPRSPGGTDSPATSSGTFSPAPGHLGRPSNSATGWASDRADPAGSWAQISRLV